MGKGTLFVVIYSFFLIGLFIIFTYLMTKIDPIPLSSTKIPDWEEEDFTESYQSGQNVDHSAFKFVGVDNQNRTYDAEFSNDGGQNVVQQPQKFSPVNRIDPPVWPNVATTVDNKITDTAVDSAAGKGFRRSVKENAETYDKSDSVVLRIVDSKGQSRIEISVGSKEFSDRQKPWKDSSIGSKVKQNEYTFDVNNILKANKTIPKKHTVIKLLPDNTLVIDNLPNFKESFENISETMDTSINKVTELNNAVTWINLTNNRNKIIEFEDTTPIISNTIESVKWMNGLEFDTVSHFKLNNSLNENIVTHSIIEHSTNKVDSSLNKFNELDEKFITDNVSMQQKSLTQINNTHETTIFGSNVLSKFDTIPEFTQPFTDTTGLDTQNMNTDTTTTFPYEENTNTETNTIYNDLNSNLMENYTTKDKQYFNKGIADTDFNQNANVSSLGMGFKTETTTEYDVISISHKITETDTSVFDLTTVSVVEFIMKSVNTKPSVEETSVDTTTERKTFNVNTWTGVKSNVLVANMRGDKTISVKISNGEAALDTTAVQETN